MSSLERLLDKLATEKLLQQLHRHQAAQGSAVALQLNAVCFCRMQQRLRNASLLCSGRRMLQLPFLRDHTIDLRLGLAA